MIKAVSKCNYARGEIPSSFRRLLFSFSVYFFLLLIGWQYLYAMEVKEPVKPHTPDVDSSRFKSFTTDEVKNNISVDVLFYVHGMDAQRGRAFFPESFFSIQISGVNPPGRIIKIGDLRDIKILQWKGRTEKKRAFIFYPEKYVLNLRSGESIEVEKNISFLNNLRLERGGRGESFYSYFYDYYRNGLWVNRNETDPETESQAPVKGCVTGIRFYP